MLKGYQPDLEALLANWGLKPIQAEKIKDVFKVDTAQGVKNLKVSPLKPKRLIFVHQAINHLIKNGFTKMNPIIPTLQGGTYVSDGQFAYTLFDWIAGRQCNFANQAELAEATRVLAELHRRTLGFVPPPHSNMRKQWEMFASFPRSDSQLKEYRQNGSPNAPTKACNVYLENCELFYHPLADQAINN